MKRATTQGRPYGGIVCFRITDKVSWRDGFWVSDFSVSKHRGELTGQIHLHNNNLVPKGNNKLVLIKTGKLK